MLRDLEVAMFVAAAATLVVTSWLISSLVALDFGRLVLLLLGALAVLFGFRLARVLRGLGKTADAWRQQPRASDRDEGR